MLHIKHLAFGNMSHVRHSKNNVIVIVNAVAIFNTCVTISSPVPSPTHRLVFAKFPEYSFHFLPSLVFPCPSYFLLSNDPERQIF